MYPNQPLRQVTRFFQAPVQRDAAPRGGRHPSPLAAAQRAAAAFVLKPGGSPEAQLKPPMAGLVCCYGGDGISWFGTHTTRVIWWIYLQLLTGSSVHGPHIETKCRDCFGKSAYLMSCTHWTWDVWSNKDAEVNQVNRGVEPSKWDGWPPNMKLDYMILSDFSAQMLFAEYKFGGNEFGENSFGKVSPVNQLRKELRNEMA